MHCGTKRRSACFGRPEADTKPDASARRSVELARKDRQVKGVGEGDGLFRAGRACRIGREVLHAATIAAVLGLHADLALPVVTRLGPSRVL